MNLSHPHQVEYRLGVGLLLFLVPGIIAFVVDFTTGAIYLPPSSADASLEQSPEGIVIIPSDVTQLDKKQIETLLKEHTGISIDVYDEPVKVKRLEGPSATKKAAAWLLSCKTSVQQEARREDPEQMYYRIFYSARGIKKRLFKALRPEESKNPA